MHLRTWLSIAALTTALGCGDKAGGESVTSKEETRTAALALTEAVDFENGISRTGAIPDSTEDSITLVPDTNSLQLTPGESAEMTMGFENPDEDKDPVDAVLLQFADSDDHVEVPRMVGDAGAGDAGAADSEIKMPFSVDAKVCEKLCDKVFKLSLTQAVKLKSGGVSKHKSRSFDLDCRNDGDHSLCEAVKADKPTSGTSSGTGGAGAKPASTSEGATLEKAFLSSLAGFNSALCKCVTPSMTPSCPSAALTAAQRTCMGTFAKTNAAKVMGTIACLEGQLSMCNASCDPVACDPSVLRTLSTCTPLPVDLVADYEACLPAKDVAPPGADAGISPAP